MDNFDVRNGEQEKDYLLRVGRAKEEGGLDKTWQELTNILNGAFRVGQHYDSESCWRKKYKRIAHADQEDIEEFRELDVASANRRTVRKEARIVDFQEKLLEAVKKVEPIHVGQHIKAPEDQQKAIVGMLGDIHYGLEFHNRLGDYSSDIAKGRVMDYADFLIELGAKNNISDIYVPLMGDLVSGIIHNTIRIENRENLIEQIMGVSELIATFLLQLSLHFDNIYVISVDGNHSRIDLNADAGLKDERLDALVAWYCKARTLLVKNITFLNSMDSTIAEFDLFGKQYVCVHGDMDPNLRTSAERISTMLDKHIDYILSAHTHVPAMRFEYTGYITNGCVCGTGDNYTAKMRFHSPAMQVALICSGEGVESINPFYMK